MATGPRRRSASTSASSADRAAALRETALASGLSWSRSGVLSSPAITMAGSPSTPARRSSESSGRMAGEYRLLRKLGEGGFGAVYEAEHPLLKRRAAVQVLHQVARMDSEAVLRFVAE